MKNPMHSPFLLTSTALLTVSLAAAGGTAGSGRDQAPAPRPAVLDPETLANYVAAFNHHDQELYPQHVPNAAAWAWLRQNVPLALGCPRAARLHSLVLQPAGAGPVRGLAAASRTGRKSGPPRSWVACSHRCLPPRTRRWGLSDPAPADDRCPRTTLPGYRSNPGYQLASLRDAFAA